MDKIISVLITTIRVILLGIITIILFVSANFLVFNGIVPHMILVASTVVTVGTTESFIKRRLGKETNKGFLFWLFVGLVIILAFLINMFLLDNMFGTALVAGIGGGIGGGIGEMLLDKGKKDIKEDGGKNEEGE